MEISVKERVQVNAPFRMLVETFLPLFIEHRLNPEIGLNADALASYAISDFAAVADLFHKRSLSITLHGPFMDLCVGSPDPAIRSVTRRRLQQLLALVPLFKPKSVVCHAGYDFRRYGFMQAEWLAKSVEIWTWMAERLESHGCRLMLENVFERHPDEILPVLERLQSHHVGLCLDTGHQSAFGQAPLKEWIDKCGPHMGQCHLHDNCGDEDAHLALGQGDIDFQPLFQFLSLRGTELPIITLEPHKAEDLWHSLDYLAKNWS